MASDESRQYGATQQQPRPYAHGRGRAGSESIPRSHLAAGGRHSSFAITPLPRSQTRTSTDGERAWLLRPRTSVDLTGDRYSRSRSRDQTPNRRRSWLFNSRPGAGDPQKGTILPTTMASSANSSGAQAASSADLNRRVTIKEVPGQTTDPEDPLNRAVPAAWSAREGMVRHESFQSVMSNSSIASNGHYSGSISARRNQLQRQNSIGAPPSRFVGLCYSLRDLILSPDTTDEKITSTILNVVNVVVDAIFCFLYLIEASYLTRPIGYESDWRFIERSETFWHILVVIAAYNFTTVLCSVLFAESKWTSVRSTRHIVSTLVAIPFIVSVFISNGQHLYVPYFLQSLALVSRVQQMLNFYIDIGVSDLPMDPLKSKMIVFAAYIVTLIYCAVSAFQIAEYDQLIESGDHNNLLKLLYFVLITMSTIGYGDVTPKNQIGYAIVILVITAVVSVFPWMIGGIIDALEQAKAGEGIFKTGGHKFMIISGSLHSAQKLANVLNGFWFTNKEYSNSSFKIVILGLSEPSKEVQALLQSARYKNRVVYLKGTPLDSKDLERIQARYAEGIFIIADRNSPFTPQEEDRHNTLSTLAFRNVSDSAIYTYNLLPETEIFQKMAATQVVCADELRQVLLAFNCMQQASATLILNLLHQHRPSQKFSELWEAEYDDSLGNEFYISYLNPIFDGKPFGFVSWFLYRRFQVVLFGVRIRLQSGEYHTALNPGKEYRFQHNEQCIFIAQNPKDLEDIGELTERQLDGFLQHLNKTQDDGYEGIGPEYHAKNFGKALQTLTSTHHCGLAARKSRLSHRRFQSDRNSVNYRKTAPFHINTVLPTIVANEEEIDVEPEVCFIPEGDNESSDQGPKEPGSPVSPRAQLTKEFLREHTKSTESTPKSIERDFLQLKVPHTRGSENSLNRLALLDEDSTGLRVGYPTSPYAGAKMPLCILLEPSLIKDRQISSMVTSRWEDVIEQRKEQQEAAELERTGGAISEGELSNPPISPTFFRKRGDRESKKSGSDPSQGHVLVCSPNYDIFRLVCTLRSAHLKKLQDIVILCSRQPNPQEFKLLKCFPRLYFLIGDCLSRDDLERAAITKSSKYLFLRHPENGGVDGSFLDSIAVINRILVQQIFSDHQATKLNQLNSGSKTGNSNGNSNGIGSSNILKTPAMSLPREDLATMEHGPPTTKTVTLQSLNDGPQCVYELVEERSVEFLQLRKTDGSIDRHGHDIAEPHVAQMGGADYSLETPAFGPETDSGYYGFPQTQVARRRATSDQGAADFYHNPIYASGGVLVGGLLDHVLYQLYSNPSLLQLIKLLCGIQTKADVKRDYHLFKQYGAGCYLECIPVPEGFGVKTIQSGSCCASSASSGGSGSGTSSGNSSDDEAAATTTEDQASDVPEASTPSEHPHNHRHHQKQSTPLKKDTENVSSFSKGKQKLTELFERGTSGRRSKSRRNKAKHHGHTGGSSGYGACSGECGPSLDSDYFYDHRHINFLHLYEHLALDMGVIPIGLLRLQGDDPTMVHLGIGGSSRCYSVTNPLLDTIVLDTDMVFVLTRGKGDQK
ncbi:hypothetical protein BGW38_002343 [Lunasporangiospora selenospora]|uniref:Uncharacterized protein n=1 Tax=Lunasporangiospora selenospora TaxID=979761 RepID=A0A9P6G1Q3_9FUNG|nr:hypothetical protein BGW38_002343 [Lunasporangiospora selenospora]